MLLINLFKNFKIKLIFFFFFLALIILACTLWQIKINDNRIIYWEPDDHFTFLNKTASFDYCKNEFDVYVNGQYIDKAAYTWTPDENTTQTIVFNTGTLGYDILNTDTVIVNGRWA